jgi:hypothetical protein
MSVEISSLANIGTLGYPVITYLNDEGTKLCLVYKIPSTQGREVFPVELFNITDAGTRTIAEYKDEFVDGGFNDVTSGAANSDMTHFTIIKTSKATNNRSKFQLSLLEYDGTRVLKKKKTVTLDGLGIKLTPLGGTFTKDGGLIIVTAVKPSSEANVNQDSLIYLIDSKTLDVVLKHVVTERVYTCNPLPVDFGEDQYFITTSAQGKLDMNDRSANWRPMFALEAWKITKQRGVYSISMVSDVILSQGAIALSVNKVCSNKWAISVGLSLAILEGEMAIMDRNSKNEAASGTSGDELALFIFDKDESLIEDCSFNMEMSVDGSFILPNHSIVFYSQQSPQNTSTLEIGSIDECCEMSVTVAVPIGTFPSFATNLDNSLLVVASGSTTDPGQKNLFIYKVSH